MTYRDDHRARLRGHTYNQLAAETSRLIDQNATLRRQQRELETLVSELRTVQRLIPIGYHQAYANLEDQALNGAPPGDIARYERSADSRPPKHDPHAYTLLVAEQRWIRKTLADRAAIVARNLGKLHDPPKTTATAR